MYGLPRDYDLSVLVGQELQSICFAAFEIYLGFGADILISVGGHIEFEGCVTELPVKSTGLMSLIGLRVASAHAEGKGDLVLTFEDGRTLGILETMDNYECYSITVGEKTIYV